MNSWEELATNPKGGKGRTFELNPGQRLSPGVCTVSGRSLQCWAWKGKGSRRHPTHCPRCSAGSFLERQKKRKNQMAVTISTPSIITNCFSFLQIYSVKGLPDTHKRSQ